MTAGGRLLVTRPAFAFPDQLEGLRRKVCPTYTAMSVRRSGEMGARADV